MAAAAAPASGAIQGVDAAWNATAPVAVIGVGNMGGAMAQNLLVQGWRVQICDIVPERVQALQPLGALACAQPAMAAAGACAVVVCVVDAAQTQSVLFGVGGVAEVLRSGQAVMLCPTIGPPDTERFAGLLAQRGVDTIDAPMSGGPARARDGSMSLMVACPDAVFARHERLIRALSSNVFRISERVGDGARTKLVNNLLAGINLAGAAEALALARRMGLDPGRTLDVIERSSGQSWIGSDRLRRAIAGEAAPRAHMTLLEKDTRLAVEAARQLGFAGALGPQARDLFAQASAAGLAASDDSALFDWWLARNPPA
ncbi:MAG: hypothetical protein RLZ81_1669, partial [Pseudomonadota bacterium]